MKAGDRVQWTLKDGTPGSGAVLSLWHGILSLWHGIDGTAPDVTHAMVAVDPKPDAPSAFTREVHPVIFCTVTWLTVLS